MPLSWKSYIFTLKNILYCFSVPTKLSLASYITLPSLVWFTPVAFFGHLLFLEIYENHLLRFYLKTYVYFLTASSSNLGKFLLKSTIPSTVESPNISAYSCVMFSGISFNSLNLDISLPLNAVCISSVILVFQASVLFSSAYIA